MSEENDITDKTPFEEENEISTEIAISCLNKCVDKEKLKSDDEFTKEDEECIANCALKYFGTSELVKNVYSCIVNEKEIFDDEEKEYLNRNSKDQTEENEKSNEKEIQNIENKEETDKIKK